MRFAPVIVVYDLSGRPLTRVDGEIRTAEEFMLLGEYVASGAHARMKFADFKQGARSR